MAFSDWIGFEFDSCRFLRMIFRILLSDWLKAETCPTMRFLTSTLNWGRVCFFSSWSMSSVTCVATLARTLSTSSSHFGWPRTTAKCSLKDWRNWADRSSSDPMFWLNETSRTELRISTEKSLLRSSAKRVSSNARLCGKRFNCDYESVRDSSGCYSRGKWPTSGHGFFRSHINSSMKESMRRDEITLTESVEEVADSGLDGFLLRYNHSRVFRKPSEIQI